ncbi:hypothetical protein DITRI_Ditri16bG0036400 [Diplodiscus trichospermus]
MTTLPQNLKVSEEPKHPLNYQDERMRNVGSRKAWLPTRVGKEDKEDGCINWRRDDRRHRLGERSLGGF